MKIDILSLFPEMFEGFLNTSIIHRARANGYVSIAIHNFRDFALDRHKSVDDTPYGGGQGMVLKCQPLLDCLETVVDRESLVVLMSPQGHPFNQSTAKRLSQEKHLVMICGHYEGFDERIRDYVDEEISIGDYVLTGGELPAMVITDSVVRLLDGVITKASHEDDSFADGLLEYPQYTHPYDYKGETVPDVLLSGHHENIRRWRLKQSLKRTLIKRPDLLSQRKLSQEEQLLLEEIKKNIE
ncbi:MAG: tRNA (guanosine(37)-N1)-methyltransferase TrmD [Erysipelotrichaceae bacterium]|nr:tRNA (guanosine(37)-N1)-methyltransferase TrmD [Erysipelotrichaceae bacterium]